MRNIRLLRDEVFCDEGMAAGSVQAMVTMKKRLGRMIPYPMIETGRRVYHFGFKNCEICSAGSRHRLDSGYGYPVLEELQVVGGLMRRADKCPVCHSGSRERLIWFYLTRHFFPSKGASKLTVAHFAPEKGLSRELQSRCGQYTAYDLSPDRYRHMSGIEQQNLEMLTIRDETVDLLMANHILEHVYDLPKALREIRRVLSNDGLAIMQVPLSLKLAQMLDDGIDCSEEERIAQFGQDDHVRLFTPAAYMAALREAGLTVERFDPFEDDAKLATQWEIDPFEPLFLIGKG